MDTPTTFTLDERATFVDGIDKALAANPEAEKIGLMLDRSMLEKMLGTISLPALEGVRLIPAHIQTEREDYWRNEALSNIAKTYLHVPPEELLYLTERNNFLREELDVAQRSLEEVDERLTALEERETVGEDVAGPPRISTGFRGLNPDRALSDTMNDLFELSGKVQQNLAARGDVHPKREMMQLGLAVVFNIDRDKIEVPESVDDLPQKVLAHFMVGATNAAAVLLKEGFLDTDAISVLHEGKEINLKVEAHRETVTEIRA